MRIRFSVPYNAAVSVDIDNISYQIAIYDILFKKTRTTTTRMESPQDDDDERLGIVLNSFSYPCCVIDHTDQTVNI